MNYPDYMYDYGADLVANGFRIIPLEPGTKRPGRLHGGKDWYGLDDWSKHCGRTNGAFELRMWSKWPGCGIGIACGYPTIGVDIDILEDEVLAHRVRAIALEHLGATPAVRIGRMPKVLLAYQTREPIPTIKQKPIEILGHGAQFVAYGIHPDTQKPYRWVDEGLVDLGADQLPTVTQDMLEAFLEEAHKFVPDHLKGGKGAMRAGQGQASPHGAAANLEAVKDAMAAIPNEDLQWDDWSRVGMAAWAATEGSDEGYAIFEEWSAKSSKHVAKACRERWDHWRRSPPSELGFGTLFHEAQAAGWVPPSGLIFDADLAQLPPAEILIKSEARAAKPTAPAKTEEYRVPDHLLDLDGGLKEFVDWCVSTAPAPQPFLALAAALPLFGVLTGRKYETQTRLRGNIYTVGIADSGGGKDHARKCVSSLLMEAGLSRYLGGDDLGSGQAILSALHKHPALLFRSDEFGKHLQGWTARNAAAHKAQIWTKLTELFSSANSMVGGTEYANQKERPREDVIQPCVGFMGTTVPGPFWQALQSGAMTDGSLARFLICRTDNDYPDPMDASEFQPPKSLIECCQAIVAGARGHDGGGNLADLMMATGNPQPYRVPQTPEADAILKAVRARQLEWLRSCKGTNLTSFASRLFEHTAKLAMVRAVARDPAAPVIVEIDVVWARDLTDHCLNTLISDSDANLAENETEANHKKVLRLIQKAKENGIIRSEITLATKNLRRPERSDILRSLIEAEQVVMYRIGGDAAGRPPDRFFAKEYDPKHIEAHDGCDDRAA